MPPPVKLSGESADKLRFAVLRMNSAMLAFSGVSAMLEEADGLNGKMLRELILPHLEQLAEAKDLLHEVNEDMTH